MSEIPTHFSDEKTKGTIVIAVGAGITFLLLINLIQLVPFAAWLPSQEMNTKTWQDSSAFFSALYHPKLLIEYMKYSWAANQTNTIVAGLGLLLLSAIPIAVAATTNPYRMHELIHGDARKGTLRDIRQMEKRKQVGINGGTYLTLGQWPETKEHIRLIETLSVLVLAPPGTGKTASFVVPSITETDDSSFIINDPKPELFSMTSGYRHKVGHVFMIDWSATDKIADSAGNPLPPEEMVFYPRFNVLSPQLLPDEGTAGRDTYLDAIANVLSPGGDKGGKSDYFEQKGRAALVGFLHYVCSKVVDKQNNTGLPERWRDAAEPCIPLLIDLVNEGLRRASDQNDEAKAEAANSDKFHQGDAMSDWLKAIVKECLDHGYNPRAATELTPLISMAPNERSGVLGTMDKAFLPFKNAAVQERTTTSDFVPADLRGLKEEKDVKDSPMVPVTLYVCANQAEAAAFSTITTLLYEVLSLEFLAYGPNETNKKGKTLGPFPVCFMLDEFAKLPRIESVMTGPDLGRSKKTFYCLVAQAESQIAKIYSKEDQKIMYTTTAVKYVLPQNDKDTIALVQAMVGPTTLKRKNLSHSKGGGFKEMGKGNVSYVLEKADFIRPGDISSMRQGYHMLICQGFMSRPYLVKSTMFFEEPTILEKVFNPRTGKGPKPCRPVPDYIHNKRVDEVMAQRRSQEQASIDPIYEGVLLDE